MSADMVGWSLPRGSATGFWWVEVREAAKPPTSYRAQGTPPPPVQNDPVQNVHSAEVETC